MAARYFDDFSVGEVFTSGGVTVTETAILDFALSYDPQPFHIDVNAAAEGPFAGLCASGFQTLALSFRVFYDANVINACSLGSPGFDELRWTAPVRPGDTLSVEARVRETRPSKSKPDRGILMLDFATRNQHGHTVMTFKAIILAIRKTGTDG